MKSLEKTQEELDEEFYKDKNFEKNESKILEEQSKIIEILLDKWILLKKIG